MKQYDMKPCGMVLSGTDPADVFFEGETHLLEFSNDLTRTGVTSQQEGSCVSQVCFEMFDWYCRMKGIKNTLHRTALYDWREDVKVDGMMPREALNILKRENFIHTFARLTNIDAIRKSIVVNGAALIALPVYDYSPEFWKGGSSPIGYHAVTAYGFDERGMEIKNSWGMDWADYGCSRIGVEDYSRIIEAWTIIA